MTRSWVRTVALTAVLVGACLTPAAASAVTLPTANAQFDYQIGGVYTPLAEVGIVDRDRNASPVAGKYNVCYINAFQTQPEETEWWMENHSELLLRDRRGEYVIDGEWNEVLLDISTSTKRAAILTILNEWIDGCAEDGFDAIEPDNLESWTRSNRLLDEADAIDLATEFTAHAHEAELAVAQKNTSELGEVGKDVIGFDFAIAEECHAYRECGEYMAVFGNQVYEIEYTDNGGLRNYESACSSHGSRISIIYRDRNVVPRGTAGYTYRWC